MISSLIFRKAFLVFAVSVAVATFATSAMAQVEQPSQISVQGTGLFTKSLKDQNPSYDATDSGGLLVGYSYQFSRWFGVEGNYGYSRNTQNYFTLGGAPSIQSDIHQTTAALVAHIPIGVRRIRPYALGGGGALVFDPTDKFVVPGADRQTRGTFLYGGGANFDLTNHFGFRAEYRGLVYKAPDFQLSTLNADKFTHLAQPSFGVYARF
jgi:opacity protein-like surface antigen